MLSRLRNGTVSPSGEFPFVVDNDRNVTFKFYSGDQVSNMDFMPISGSILLGGPTVNNSGLSVIDWTGSVNTVLDEDGSFNPSTMNAHDKQLYDRMTSSRCVFITGIVDGKLRSYNLFSIISTIDPAKIDELIERLNEIDLSALTNIRYDKSSNTTTISGTVNLPDNINVSGDKLTLTDKGMTLNEALNQPMPDISDLSQIKYTADDRTTSIYANVAIVGGDKSGSACSSNTLTINENVNTKVESQSVEITSQRVDGNGDGLFLSVGPEDVSNTSGKVNFGNFYREMQRLNTSLETVVSKIDVLNNLLEHSVELFGSMRKLYFVADPVDPNNSKPDDVNTVPFIVDGAPYVDGTQNAQPNVKPPNGYGYKKL